MIAVRGRLVRNSVIEELSNERLLLFFYGSRAYSRLLTSSSACLLVCLASS